MVQTLNESDLDTAERAKNLTDYTEKAFDFSRDGESMMSDSAWSSEHKAFMDNATLKSLFFSEDWVYIFCDLIGQKLSAQRMIVKKRTVSKGREVVEPDPSHKLNGLLRSPNDFQDYHEYMYVSIIEHILMGNNIAWNNKRKNTLTVLPADLISIDFKQNGEINQYLLGSNSIDLQGIINKENMTPFPVNEIIHSRRPNPASMLWGLSPFIPGRKSILFNRYSTDYLNAFYLKQATPGLALTMDRQVNEDLALRQLRTFEMAYTGRRNMRRTLILPKGVDAKPLSHSIADQKLVEQIDKNRETLMNLLKIPKHELSLASSGSLGSEEARLALRNFWEATLIPTGNQISGAFTRFFAKELGPDRFFAFDLDDVEALQEDKFRKAELADRLSKSVMSVNEVRRDLYDMEASNSPHGDTPGLLVPKIPGGGPEQDEGLRDEEGGVKAVLADDDEIDLIFNKSGTSLEVFQKKLEEESEKPIEEFLDFQVEIYAEMTVAAIKEFEDLFKKSIHLKQEDEKLKKLRKQIEKAVKQLEEKWSRNYMKSLEESIEKGYDTQLEFVKSPRDRAAIEAIKERTASNRRAILSARGIESFANISKTQTEKIMKEIEVGLEKKLTIDEITKRIVVLFKDPLGVLGRAKTIARTEVLTAVSIGQWMSAKHVEEVIPGTKKMWITALDERVRSSHKELHGSKQDMNKKFGNGLRYPRDLIGEASEVVNCRCSLIIIPPEEGS